MNTMSETARALRFKHFRGLPDNQIELKGRNLVVLGCNGKGKSAVVDGFEFCLQAGEDRLLAGGVRGRCFHQDQVAQQVGHRRARALQVV